MTNAARDITGRGTLPVRDLIAELWHDLELLVRQEIALARAEFVENVAVLGRRLIQAVVGVVLLGVGVAALVATMILVLIALHIVAWLSAFIVAAALMSTGAICVASAVKHLKPSEIALQRASRELRETVSWARNGA